MKTLSPFAEKVIATILKIPKGKVATYKQIAELSGKPHASRGVAWILNSCSRKYKLPWQRVLGSSGRISFKPLTRNYALQRLKLKNEGIRFESGDAIDLGKFQWKKRAPKPKPRRGQPKMFGNL